MEEVSSSQSFPSSSSASSFLSQLKGKLKGGLKPTQTKTTFPDGSVQYFTCQGNSLDESKSSNTIKSTGFVVDDKPDLSIGKVRPWLFVSSQDVPNDAKLLQENGISHIVSLLPGFLLSKECTDIVDSHLILDVYDEETFELDMDLFMKIFEIIETAKKDKGKAVLVHCNAGISRAPTVAIAYLIKFENLSFTEALDQLKSVRPLARPNAGFLKQLRNLSSV